MKRPLITLAVVLAGCAKPSTPTPLAGASATASSAKPVSLLHAEWRRDPSGVPEEELVAEDVSRRLAAVRTLASIQDEKSLDTLLKALADEDGFVVSWAAFGAGQLCRGHEADVVHRLVLRAASLWAGIPSDERDYALGTVAHSLGHCATEEAEKTLRNWLKLRHPIAAAATLGLGEVARERKRLDDVTVAALLDFAASNPASSALYPFESLPALGAAARDRLVEVASRALEQPSSGRAFAIRALAKGGPNAAAPLRRALEAEATPDAERADAARSLAALGNAGQADLAAALEGRVRALRESKGWLGTAHGVVLTMLQGLEPKSADPALLADIAQLSLLDELAPVVRRKIQLRCRAASLLAGRASASKLLQECDVSLPAEHRVGDLALLEVLGRGPLTEARGVRFEQLAHAADRVVREAALDLLLAHDEAPHIPELLAEALAAKEAGVRATAAKVLARYPARAQQTSPGKAEERATPPADPRVVQALTKALSEVGTTHNVELASALLDAAASLELLGAKPALERACTSDNATLRKHAERAYAQLGEPGRRCPNVPSSATETETETWSATPPKSLRVQFETDVGPLSLTLWGNVSPFATARFAELVGSGFFDGMLVHRVVPGFVTQFGDPDGDGFGGPDLAPLRDQTSTDAFDPGSVGVALAGRDTGISQFFVTLREAPHLAGQYSQIGKADPGWERLAAGDRILKARVLEADAK